MYMVYEAKRFSEKADGVGPITSLLWMSPATYVTEKIGIASTSGLALLETIYQKYRQQGSVSIDPFPDDFSFSAASPDPQHPTDDQSDQKPLLE